LSHLLIEEVNQSKLNLKAKTAKLITLHNYSFIHSRIYIAPNYIIDKVYLLSFHLQSLD